MKTKNLFAFILLLASSYSSVAQTNGTMLWSRDLQFKVQNSSPALSTNGVIFISSASNFTALNLSGNILWQIPLVNQYYGGLAANIAAVEGSSVYVRGSFTPGSLVSEVGIYSFDESGITNWFIRGGFGPPAITTNRELYLARDAYFMKVDSAGNILWTFRHFNEQLAFPVIGFEGTTYFGSYHANIYSLNPDGTQRWTKYIGSLWDYSPAIDANGNVYGGAAMTASGCLLSTAPNGATNWIFSVQVWPVVNEIHTAPIVGRYGIIYCTTTNGTCYAVNPNGTKKWQFNVGSPIYSSPALAEDGTIYFGSDNGKLNAIVDNGTNASWKWTFQTGGAVRSSPTIGSDGTVYVGSDDGKLYAIKGSAPLADTAWPMYRHDPQHTARVSRIVRTPPSIQTSSQTNGLMNITLQGEWGQTYQIENSSDLTQWNSFTNVINTNGTFSISEPATNACRFYRVTMP